MSIDDVTYNRRQVQLQASKVKEILPEHFAGSYPELVRFLELYYTFLDSDSTYNFSRQINTIDTSRDIEDSTIDQLNLLFKEIGINTVNTNYFRNPRFVARLIANFYRVKGSLYSTEGFFKAFYNTDVDVIYPKRVVFEVDNSLIGPEDQAIIQDGALYQTLSVLLRSDVPISVWGDLYRKFVHPAGLYLGSEVTFTGIATMLQNDMPQVVFGAIDKVYVDTATSIAAPFADTTLVVPFGTGGQFTRIDPNFDLTSFSTIIIGQANSVYRSIAELASVGGPKFDEDNDIDGVSMDMSNTVETMDKVDYKTYS